MSTVVDEFLALVEQHGLSDLEAGALTGVAPATVKVVRLTRAAPKHPRPRASLAAFVEANRGAGSRAELRMTASGLPLAPSTVDMGRSTIADHGAGR
jgi:hypothetical protein